MMIVQWLAELLLDKDVLGLVPAAASSIFTLIYKMGGGLQKWKRDEIFRCLVFREPIAGHFKGTTRCHFIKL